MKKGYSIALSGNPNSGKTTVFNAITGARQHIANYPGVTVEKKIGRVTHKGYEIEVIDLPGTYSLTAYSLEEIVARDFLVNERPDVVVDIVDASNLDRNLYLAVQFMELGIPLIIALNMMDLAESRGVTVDHEALSNLIGVPVVPMVARLKKGIGQLLDKVIEEAEGSRDWHPAVISYGMDIDQSLSEIENVLAPSQVFDAKYPPRWLALKCLEGDSQIWALLKKDNDIREKIEALCQSTLKHTVHTLEEEPEGIIAEHRYGYIAGITKQSVKRKIEFRLNFSDKMDRVLTNRILGPLIMISILYGIYVFTFWASDVPIDWFGTLFDKLKSMVTLVIPPGNLRSLIISGVIDGVGGVLGFIPLILFMFFSIAILEDSGYMARVAYMLDRVLRWFGLHGNSVMALIVSGGISGGCAVPGVLATRTLRDPRERIATLLVVPFMNCGAKLPIFAVLIGAFFAKHKAQMMFILTLLSWGFALLAAKFIRSTVLRGPKTPFVMELPPYRAPTIRGLLIHTWERTWHYVKKAGTIILAFSILFWAMMTFPRLPKEQVHAFEEHRAQLSQSLLASEDLRTWIPSEQALKELDHLYASMSQAGGLPEPTPVGGIENETLYALAKAAHLLKVADSDQGRFHSPYLEGAKQYLDFRGEMTRVDIQEHQAALRYTLAGRIGERLETVTWPLGFDYRINIALLGGFAAKEVVVSTLGTAYSLGQGGSAEEGSLSERLRNDPDWNALTAITLLIFTMLYVPCLVTVISIGRESAWVWAGFSVAFNLAVAFLVALVIRQVGTAVGLGT